MIPIGTININTNVHITLETLRELANKYPNEVNLIDHMMDTRTGEVPYRAYFNFKFPNHNIGYMKYNSTDNKLECGFSYLRFTLGDNTYNFNWNSDIDKFWSLLDSRMMEWFKVEIPHDNWITTRFDTSHNLILPSTETPSEYIDYFHNNVSIPYKEPVKYVHGISYQNLSKNKLKLYPKEQDKKLKNNPTALKRAKNMLRIEAESYTKELQTYSPSRKLVDFLSFDFFKWIMDTKYSINEKLKDKRLFELNMNRTELTYEYLKDLILSKEVKRGQAERYIAFDTVTNADVEGLTNALYSNRLYKTRQDELLELNKMLTELDKQQAKEPIQIPFNELQNTDNESNVESESTHYIYDDINTDELEELFT